MPRYETRYQNIYRINGREYSSPYKALHDTEEDAKADIRNVPNDMWVYLRTDRVDVYLLEGGERVRGEWMIAGERNYQILDAGSRGMVEGTIVNKDGTFWFVLDGHTLGERGALYGPSNILAVSELGIVGGRANQLANFEIIQ